MTTREIIAAVMSPDLPLFTARDRLHKALGGLLERQLVARVADGRGHVYSLSSAGRVETEPEERRALPPGAAGVDALLALWFGGASG